MRELLPKFKYACDAYRVNEKSLLAAGCGMLQIISELPNKCSQTQTLLQYVGKLDILSSKELGKLFDVSPRWARYSKSNESVTSLFSHRNEEKGRHRNSRLIDDTIISIFKGEQLIQYHQFYFYLGEAPTRSGCSYEAYFLEYTW